MHDVPALDAPEGLPALEAHFRLSSGDYAVFARAYENLTPLRRIARLILIAVYTGCPLLGLYLASIGDVLFGGYLIALSAALIVWHRALMPWLVERQFVTQRLGEHDAVFVADTDGFLIRTAVSEGRQRWQSIHHVDDSPGHVILWLHTRLGWIVPKRGFASPEEADRFARLALERTEGSAL